MDLTGFIFYLFLALVDWGCMLRMIYFTKKEIKLGKIIKAGDFEYKESWLRKYSSKWKKFFKFFWDFFQFKKFPSITIKDNPKEFKYRIRMHIFVCLFLFLIGMFFLILALISLFT